MHALVAYEHDGTTHMRVLRRQGESIITDRRSNNHLDAIPQRSCILVIFCLSAVVLLHVDEH